MRILVAALAVLALGGDAQAQCANGSCAAPAGFGRRAAVQYSVAPARLPAAKAPVEGTAVQPPKAVVVQYRQRRLFFRR